MSDRYTADTINDDALDQLYERLDRARDAAALHQQGLLTTAELYAVIEANPEDGPAATQATERTEEQNLVHALGGDRTAQTIAHTLTVHGHTLNAVRTMTYAELLAVPGIGGTSLARIRAALDGVPEPDAAATTEPEVCGAEPPREIIGPDGRSWTFGDCWCTRKPHRTGEHRCQPCADRHGAPAWTDEPVRQADADPDDPPVQCWHTEPGTPCDWDVCKQPERLAAGDYGTDPREQH
jgi:hypothetical protein